MRCGQKIVEGENTRGYQGEKGDETCFLALDPVSPPHHLNKWNRLDKKGQKGKRGGEGKEGGRKEGGGRKSRSLHK